MNEADIQVLASVRRAEIENEPSDRATLELHADRFWTFLEDWSGSYASLIDQGLIEGDDSGYRLTESGRPLADEYHAQRPDHFWYYYQNFYPAAQASKTHSRLCEKVFGRDLVQDGQADMDSLNDMIAYLGTKKGDAVLDLGCGAGGVSEYISDETGAHVTGLDYAASGISTASARTESKRDRLRYVQGDMNALDLPEQSFDAAFSLDTLYWAADVEEALSSLVKLIKPGGRLGIFITNVPSLDIGPGATEPRGTWVATALEKLNLEYDVHDYTESFLLFWPKLKKVATELRGDFVAEGNEFMFDSFMKDADEDYLPAAEAGKLRRYLYIVRVPG
jgi:ubiquinone/menaquinone biosynthesis C-methylase UbiE